MSDGYVEELAAFAAGLTLADVPAHVMERARLVLLDTCGAMISGRALREVSVLGAWATAKNEAAIRAFADGTAAVSQELDEGCASARGHPGAHVVPAVLAAGAERASSGSEVLAALIVGYEVAARMGAAMRLREGFHPHGTWGTPGGAVAVGRLLGLDQEQLAQAIRLGATLCLAPDYEAVREGVTSRNLWTGVGNFASFVAARAALAGYTAPRDAPANVYGRGIGTTFDREVAGRGLGEDWYLGRNYFKPYACCRHIHAPVDAFRKIVDSHSMTADDIEHVDVYTYGKAVDATGRPDVPSTPLGAKFSVADTFAVYLQRRNLDDASFNPPVLGDSALLPLMSKVRVSEDPSYTTMLPAKRGARVELVRTDGTRQVAEVFGSKGDPIDPLSPTEIQQKFMKLASSVIGEERSRLAMREVMDIERAPSIARLIDAINGSH